MSTTMPVRSILVVLCLAAAAGLGCSYDADVIPTFTEGCRPGAVRACGTDLGLCSVGTQTCTDGSWGSCSGTQPVEEACDGRDNDCDGDIDEGYGVGAECTLSGGCPGRRVCIAPGSDLDAGESDAGKDEYRPTTRCEVDPLRVAREVCDGIDNDCDGVPDYTVTPDRVDSACSCDRRVLVFAEPKDVSVTGNANLCETTACTASGGAASMTFCLSCDADAGPRPYALCESTRPVDLSRFDGPTPTGELLEVVFRYTSDLPAEVPLSLWYHAAGRKRLPLLAPGDAAGSYRKIFVQPNACLGEDNTFGQANACAAGRSGEQCPGCGETETCGDFGAGCVNIDFSRSFLQVAAEFCPAAARRASGTIELQRVSLISPDCLHER